MGEAVVSLVKTYVITTPATGMEAHVCLDKKTPIVPETIHV